MRVSPTSLSLENLTKRYADPDPKTRGDAVKNLSLTLPAGQLLTLLGPSGCGKTTTLKLIAGLLAPDAGDVRFGGASVLRLPPEQRGLGMVFQRPTLFPHLTVSGNVGFGLRLRRVRGGDLKRRIGEALERVALTGFERRFPHQLSGGQQQRVALARTLVTEPRVLLLDEPLSSLDANLRDELREVFRNLQEQLEITTVFVTHDQSEALALADVVGVMLGGRLEQLGSPAEVYERPATREVARFMGTTNFIEGTLLSGGAAFRYEGGCLHLSVALKHDTSGDTPATVTIRPERVGLKAVGFQTGTLPTHCGSYSNRLEGSVTRATYRGGVIRYEVRAGSLSLIVDSPFDVAVGAAVHLTLPPEHLITFAGKKGERLHVARKRVLDVA